MTEKEPEIRTIIERDFNARTGRKEGVTNMGEEKMEEKGGKGFEEKYGIKKRAIQR